SQACQRGREQGRSRDHQKEVRRRRRYGRIEVVVAGGCARASSGRLTQGVTPAKLCSWALDSLDSIPIGDRDSRNLALQLQFRRDCSEGISALLRFHNYTVQLRQNYFTSIALPRDYLRGTVSYPTCFFSFGAPGALSSRSAVGIVQKRREHLTVFDASAVRPSGV